MSRTTRWLVVAGLAAGGAALLGVVAHRVGRHLHAHHNDLFTGEGSHRYARWAPRLAGSLYRRVAAETAGELAHGAVLDVGCGPGTLALELGRRAPGLAVSGVDISEDMIALARRQAADAGLVERVRFETADGAALPFPDGSFDLIVSTLSMHHWERKAAVLAELARVARPGAEIRIYDVWRPELLTAAQGLPLDVRVEALPMWLGLLPLPGFRRYTLARRQAAFS
ncbi:MAG: class I SAM-dependent methyltransferase [Chloroflexales bacterium]|nr:class I SAM-dependent methyltransferase [Chloroflexales bacterium]